MGRFAGLISGDRRDVHLLPVSMMKMTQEERCNPFSSTNPLSSDHEVRREVIWKLGEMIDVHFRDNRAFARTGRAPG